MSETSEHKLIQNIRRTGGYSDDATQAEIFQTEALRFALKTPDQREQALDHVRNHITQNLVHPGGQPVEDNSTLQERSQLIGLERHLRNAHVRLKAANR